MSQFETPPFLNQKSGVAKWRSQWNTAMKRVLVWAEMCPCQVFVQIFGPYLGLWTPEDDCSFQLFAFFKFIGINYN